MRTLSRLALTTGYLLWAAFFSSLTQANKPGLYPVEVVQVRFQETARPINISALLAYKSTQKLAFKVGGPVAEILVEEGDAVIEGQVLARLETEEIEAQVGEAEARFDNAVRNAERLKKLHSQNMISLGQLQDAETELEVAQSRLRVARFNYRYSVIRAPGAGRIIRRAIETSEFIQPNQVAFVLADESRGWIMRTALSDRKVVLVKHNDPVTVRFDPWPLQTFTGHITEIAEAAETRSGLFEVEIALEPVDGIRLRDGYIGRIHIQPGKTEFVAKLPALSLVSAISPLGTVFVLNKDNTVSARQIRTHYLEGGNVAVSGDIKDGDYVVSTGAAFLDDGDKVWIVGGNKPARSSSGDEE